MILGYFANAVEIVYRGETYMQKADKKAYTERNDKSAVHKHPLQLRF